MKRRLPTRTRSGILPDFRPKALIGLLASLGLAGQIPAQEVELPGPAAPLPSPLPLGEDGAVLAPFSPSALDGASSSPAPLEIVPRPPQPREKVESFVDSLSSNDAAFEVLVGQGRVLTMKEDMAKGQNQPLIAVGDPTVVDFTVLNSRQIRLTGQRIGLTDLSITTAAGQTLTFEVHVVVDRILLSGRLKALFPDASIRISQLRDHIVVEGEARDSAQIGRIIETVAAYLESVQAAQLRKVSGQQGQAIEAMAGLNTGGPPATAPPSPAGIVPPYAVVPNLPLGGQATPEFSSPLQVEGAVTSPRIINLLRVPGTQQVLLKVRIAELNRTALRQIGANFMGVDKNTGAIIGTQIAGPVTALGRVGTTTTTTTAATTIYRQLVGGALQPLNGTQSTVFGIFQGANFEFILNALRRNSFLKILAEPNLVALSGQQASFLAGGEFPVPVPQVSASGVAPTITVRFREFGVRLNFVPFVVDDDTVRLSVAPEVSQIDFTIATTLVAGGSPVPGLNTRKAQTTVELHQGQTLAIAGLLQLSLDGSTNRIPGLGDLPILGPFFSNTTGSRTEKELVVLVTPYLIEPMDPGQVPPGPGDEVKEPNDLEFYFLNRIEGRTGVDFRSTTAWDDVFGLVRHMKLERKYLHGPSGFSD